MNNIMFNQPTNLGFYSLRPSAKLPIKATKGSACYDVYACVDEPLKLDPRERVLVPTGLIMDIPDGYSVRIHTRSGMAAKKGIGLSVSEGIIDSDYVEEVFVPMVNNTEKYFHIHDGDRVAQIELVKSTATVTGWVSERPKRGERQGGFGSTGND